MAELNYFNYFSLGKIIILFMQKQNEICTKYMQTLTMWTA